LSIAIYNLQLSTTAKGIYIMLSLQTRRGVRSCGGVTRREFLRAGSLAVGLGMAELRQLQGRDAAQRTNDKACIQLLLVGGPSHIDTWDPKPYAPDNIRSPFRAIRTNVPGVLICEHFPLMAQRADRYAILRSVFHDEPPIHEMGQQLLQTGHVHRDGVAWPHVGAVLNKLEHNDRDMPPWMLLPRSLAHDGKNLSHGQDRGFLDRVHDPYIPQIDLRRPDPASIPVAAVIPPPGRLDGCKALVEAIDRVMVEIESRQPSPSAERALWFILSEKARRSFDIEAEPARVRDRYGWNMFGQSCLLARRLVQHGVRLVTVNMFDTVFHQITWDCHANGDDLSTTLEDYKHTLCPMFDRAYTALLDDLELFGLLDQTLVVSMGEFGRTPKFNSRGGRDHWPRVWSILMAGGGVRGGQVIGRSDRNGAEPSDRPIHAAEIAATVYHSLESDHHASLQLPDGQVCPAIEAAPVMELF
jgi:uncharacterized protein (DUF1501 family)